MPDSAPSKARRERAESIAIQALGFFAQDPDRLGNFLAETGLGPDSLRDAAKQPAFLAGVLDHLMRDEAVLLAFALSANVEPNAIVRAHADLGGRSWERDIP